MDQDQAQFNSNETSKRIASGKIKEDASNKSSALQRKKSTVSSKKGKAAD
jgi:hypothetical protein